ncbi:MAG TPA: hypothetical protein VLM88_02360 [Proteiniclasticum sp.]|nr:hypothetical protein [Proteiniclasticum sp.]
MKRRNITITIVLLALFTAIILWRLTDANPLESLKPEEIREITISSPGEFFTITEANDIELLFSALQSMKLRRSLSSNKDGFAFLIDIDLESGERIQMSVLSEDIHIDGRNYRPKADPSEDIRRVFDRLAKEYEVNPS